ncbi:MAG: ATP-binding protein [bacterium]
MGMEELAVSIAEEKMRAAIARASSLEGHDPAGAANAYDEAAAQADKVAKLARTAYTQGQARIRVQQLRDRAANLRSPPRPPPGNSRTRTRDDKAGSPASEEDEDQGSLDRRIEAMIETSKTRWEDIAGLEETKRTIVSAIQMFFREKPEGLKIGVPDKILMYGPPGTGKTLLASAAASANGMTFFNVNLANLESKWVGDSGKLLTTLYKKAEQRAPSIVFLDEFTRLGRHTEGSHEVATQLHDTFLQMLDGFSAKGGPPKVITIATTNRPDEISDAIRSRFKKKVYVPLPDAAARQQIVRLETRGHELAFDLAQLVSRTERYSGRDLKNLCDDAVHAMLQDANPSLGDASADFKSGEKLRTLPLTWAHFEKAMRSVPAALKPEQLQYYENYASSQSSGGKT